jgi:hypothetical protein
MQHASSSVGALAAALAKAQAELLNPEKSLLATIPSPAGNGPERSFRYAPLSTGLNIIRKSLGRHEIATIQRTAIDESGLIRLTTVLAHSSGEWISSDWPVCPVSETASPHRLGAALTYARRYALFTLVGIAGEDDTDAPDLAVRRHHQDQISDVRSAVHSDSAEAADPVRAAPSRGRPRRSPKHTLSETESARACEQLKAELADIASEDELVAWATRILPTKNALTSEDAAAIEHAFETRLQALAPSTPEPPDSESSPSAGCQDDTADGVFAIPKTPRRRDKQHLRFVSSQPCLVCGRSPADAHHLRFAQPRALGRKVSDEFTVPLCRTHHRALHDTADERAWWEGVRINPAPVAHQLWRETHEPPTAPF